MVKAAYRITLKPFLNKAPFPIENETLEKYEII